jgi:hypothetical protein
MPMILPGGSSAGSSSGIFDGGNLRIEFLRRFDYDGDGKLNAQERLRLAVELRRRGISDDRIGQQLSRLALIDRFDADGDGRISAVEAQAARQAATQRTTTATATAKKRSPSRKQAEILAKYDANADGRLSAAEKAKMRQDQKPLDDAAEEAAALTEHANERENAALRPIEPNETVEGLKDIAARTGNAALLPIH